MIEVTREHAARVLEVVDQGLSSGLGVAKPGEMCVEAAVCFALGLPHSDNPPCVGSAVRAFKIALNDSAWSSKAARAKGLRRLAIAQLGSDTIDQTEFATKVAIGMVNKILPIALRAANLETHAVACENAVDLPTCEEAAEAAARAAAMAAARAAAMAAMAARAAARAAAMAEAAEAAAWAAAAREDEILTIAAEIAVEALQDSPGYQWLDLAA